MLGLFLFIVFLCVILSYAIFFPRVNAIYKDNPNIINKIFVLPPGFEPG